MPSDRELIEAAAQAARIEGRFYNGAIPQHTGIYVGDNRYWNPLEDDGDALRLAVKLRLNFSDSALWLEHNDQGHYDPYAATRRVIVRAAAALAPATT